MSGGLLLYELTLTRVFAVVLFSDLAHLSLSLAMLGVGLGALVQHLAAPVRADNLTEALSRLSLLQAIATVTAIAGVVWLPLVNTEAALESNWFARSAQRFDLMNWGWFAVLLPLLALPAVCTGVALAGAFEHRRERLGALYGADLIGAGLAAAVFLPAVQGLGGPDAVWLAAAACAMAGGLLAHRTLSASLLAGTLAAGAVAATGTPVLSISTSASWSEAAVIETRWTALSRLTRYEATDREYVLLDNASLSPILRDEADFAWTDAMANRSIVYFLDVPDGPVAILAAAAGAEVALARQAGFSEIDAVDIEGEIFSMIAQRDDTALNPYRDGTVRRIEADARSAMMQAPIRHYHIIQLLNANLLGAAGQLAKSWSPSLLHTKEALGVYIDRLAVDGVLSLTAMDQTRWTPRIAAAALKERGVSEPYRHIAYVGGVNEVLLVRPRPWTDDELRSLGRAIRRYPGTPMVLNPTAPLKNPTARLRLLPAPFSHLQPGQMGMEERREGNTSVEEAAVVPPILTDDHPYPDTLPTVRDAVLSGSFPDGMLYRTILLQGALLALAGGVFIGAPLLSRRRAEVRGELAVIGYVACLGYGYLAVETVLIHSLALFIGHPVYALTTVVLAMLVSSGVGSLLAERGAPLPRLRLAIAAVVGLGLLQAFVTPGLLQGSLMTAPVGVRALAAGLTLAPLGFAMGMCFPLAMRLVSPRAPRLIPWAWAINGWTGVAGGVITVLLSRLAGYSWALLAALCAYALAGLLTARLSRS